VEAVGSFYLDPSPIVFDDGEPCATPVIMLIATGHVKGRKRKEHHAIGAVINQKMEQDGAATYIAVSASRPGDLKVLSEFEGELIVNTTELGAHDSGPAETGVHPVGPNHNPTFDGGDKKGLVEFSANGSL
jgi:hypothetical protein